MNFSTPSIATIWKLDSRVPILGLLISALLHISILIIFLTLFNFNFVPAQPLIIDVSFIPQAPSGSLTTSLSSLAPEPQTILPEPSKPVGLKQQPTPAKKTTPEKSRQNFSTQSSTENISNSSNTATDQSSNSNDITAHYFDNPKPIYPESARRAHKEGTVQLLVTVGVSGSADNVTISASSGFAALDDSALRTVTHWKFQPAMIGGSPVESKVEIPITFKLED